MAEKIKLSQLADQIGQTLESRFEGTALWVVAQIADVKKQVAQRRCYLKFIEKNGAETTAELRGVFWSRAYAQIEEFEKKTGQRFEDGLEITCLVLVKFHGRWGLSLEVQEIEIAYTLGSLELERQQTLERLVKENPNDIRLRDGQYYTRNQSLPLPPVIRRIALVTAPNSDGQRDFLRELQQNKFNYAFLVEEFLTQIQGDGAEHLLAAKLSEIAGRHQMFDVVAIVRGGGSQTDFRPFDTYGLSRMVATFPLPIFTGIGHDRNTSITDLMARQEKTPTKVAARIVDHNFDFEQSVLLLRDRAADAVTSRFREIREEIAGLRRIIRAASPETILSRGFALVEYQGRIITDPGLLKPGMSIVTRLRDEALHSTINSKEKIIPNDHELQDPGRSFPHRSQNAAVVPRRADRTQRGGTGPAAGSHRPGTHAD